MEILRTERMRVRQIELSDTRMLMGILMDPLIMQYLGATFDAQGVHGWIEQIRLEYPAGTGLWLAEGIADQTPLGIVGVSVIELEGVLELELHAAFLQAAWGKGFAVEAAKACVKYGFRRKRVPRIVGVIHPDNIACQKAAERVGLTFCREVRVLDRPQFVYAVKNPYLARYAA